ncbi:MAG: hypothetical protein NUV97_03225 [archaeon]|nr:hypothetical protein [archaeon]MCR4323512.1 hypothetical protein [Nanoarchaeota archaeon]
MSGDMRKSYTSRLIDGIVGPGPAKHAAAIMEYFRRDSERTQGFPPTQRIGMVWQGMLHHGVQPLILEGDVVDPRLQHLGREEQRIYLELDSAQIGLDVCVHKGLVNCATRPDTKYSLSAAGLDFIR